MTKILEKEQEKLVFAFFTQCETILYKEPITQIQKKIEEELSRNPDDVKQLVILAQLEQKYNLNETKAFKILKKVLELDSSNIDAKIDVVLLSFKKHKNDVSCLQSILDECLSQNDQYWRVYYAQGLKYLYEDNFIKAKSVLAEAHNKFPDEPWISAFYAQILSRYKSLAKIAIALVEKVIREHQLDYEVILRIASMYNSLADQEQYRYYLEQGLILNPKSPKANNNLGHYYILKDNHEKCKEYCEKALEFDPNNEDSYYNLSRCYEKKENVEESIKNLKKCIKINKKYDSALKDMVYYTYFKQGKKCLATYYLKQIFKVSSNNQYAAGFYAYLYNSNFPQQNQDQEYNEIVQLNLLNDIKSKGQQYDVIKYATQSELFNSIYDY